MPLTLEAEASDVDADVDTDVDVDADADADADAAGTSDANEVLPTGLARRACILPGADGRLLIVLPEAVDGPLPEPRLLTKKSVSSS